MCLNPWLETHHKISLPFLRTVLCNRVTRLLCRAVTLFGGWYWRQMPCDSFGWSVFCYCFSVDFKAKTVSVQIKTDNMCLFCTRVEVVEKGHITKKQVVDYTWLLVLVLKKVPLQAVEISTLSMMVQHQMKSDWWMIYCNVDKEKLIYHRLRW